jgi:hypothetical protein
MASRELRATQAPEEEVGSLERVCARFAPNFGPGAGHQGWGFCLERQHRSKSGGFAVSDAENHPGRSARQRVRPRRCRPGSSSRRSSCRTPAMHGAASRRGCNGEGLRPDCAKNRGCRGFWRKHQQEGRRPGVEFRDSEACTGSPPHLGAPPLSSLQRCLPNLVKRTSPSSGSIFP